MTFWTVFAAVVAGIITLRIGSSIFDKIASTLAEWRSAYKKREIKKPISYATTYKDFAEKRKDPNLEAFELLRDLQIQNELAIDRINALKIQKVECDRLLKEMDDCYRKSFVAMQLEPEDSDEDENDAP